MSRTYQRRRNGSDTMPALVSRTGNVRATKKKRVCVGHPFGYTGAMRSNEIRRILPQILPCLIVKREQAELLMEALVLQGSVHNIGGPRPDYNVNRSRMDDLYRQIRVLNKRGYYQQESVA